MLPHCKTPDEVEDNLMMGMVAGGERIYARYYMSCHQLDGKRDGNRFPPLAGSEWANYAPNLIFVFNVQV